MERALRPRRGRRPGAIIPTAQAPILPVLPALIPPPPRQKDPPFVPWNAIRRRGELDVSF